MKVELFTAYGWVCDECGKNSFCSSAHLNMDDKNNEAALREAFGLDEWEEIPEDLGGEWCTRPERVKCQHCGAQFDVQEPESD